MKEKYIDEKFGNWFVFGKKGALACVESSTKGEMCCVPPEQADALIKSYDAVMKALVAALTELGKHDKEAVRKIMYE